MEENAPLKGYNNLRYINTSPSKGIKTGDNLRATKLGKNKRLTALLTNVEPSSIAKLNYWPIYIMPAIPKLLRCQIIKLENESIYIANINVCVTAVSVMTIKTTTNI